MYHMCRSEVGWGSDKPNRSAQPYNMDLCTPYGIELDNATPRLLKSFQCSKQGWTLRSSQVLDYRSSLIGCANSLPFSPLRLIGSKFNRARVLWIRVDSGWDWWNIMEPVDLCGCHSLAF